MRPQEVDVSSQVITGPRRTSVDDSNGSGSGTTSAAKRYLMRRKRSKERANKEAAAAAVEEDMEESDSAVRKSNRRSSVESISSDKENRPKPPSYTPKYVVDSTSTYSYYTRLRPSRAATVSKEATEEEAESSRVNTPDLTSSSRRRSRTVDRDVSVCVTVTESLSPSPSSSNVPASGSYRSSPARQYAHTNSNDRLILPRVCENIRVEQDSVSATFLATSYNPAR